jgi:PAS domain-containing protein
MSYRSVHAAEVKRLADLRSRAAARLAGSAATKGSPASVADALGVLHALASSPDTAADALTLLHELQVHQVEVDLQSQELHESRGELESALRRQMELYDCQPAGFFSIDSRFILHGLNQTGADMLKTRRDDAFGMPFESFFCPDSARRFSAAIASLGEGRRRVSCGLELSLRDGSRRQVLACIGADPGAQLYLVNLIDTPQEGEHATEGP